MSATPEQLKALADLLRWHGVHHISEVPRRLNGELERPPVDGPRDSFGDMLPKPALTPAAQPSNVRPVTG